MTVETSRRNSRLGRRDSKPRSDRGRGVRNSLAKGDKPTPGRPVGGARHSVLRSYFPIAFCLLLLPACGYHVAGQATRIPPDVKTIAVPVFKNMSSTYRIEQQVTSAVTRELLDRTHFRIVPKVAGADAVLEGIVKDVRSRAITFDVNTGIATSLQVQVTADVKLQDLHSHKVLFSNNNYIFRQEYQISEIPSALFEEDRPALERLSRDLARTLVTDILENF
jgi:outer membrane lipopolysaccharide assembly protein LptE/RlpB